MKTWSKILSIGGAAAVVISLWSGNLPGLFGVGVIAILTSLVLWIVGKREQA